MKRRVFLDDVRVPQHTYYYTNNIIYIEQWVIVRNYNQFITDTLKNGVADTYSFDHDLADEHYILDDYETQSSEVVYDNFKEKTGYDCAKWLIQHCIDNDIVVPNLIYIHSMNPYGSANIESIFKSYAKVYDVEINIKRYL
jgi:hypothetical protein